MSDHNHLVLFGGGLDSTVLSLHLRNKIDNGDIQPGQLRFMFADYGQKASGKERLVAINYAKKLDARIHAEDLYMDWSDAHIMAHVAHKAKEANNNRLELRNPFLLMAAASIAASNFEGETTIYLGFHKEPDDAPFPDARLGWLGPMNEVLKLATTQKVRVEAPFGYMPRVEIAKYGYILDPEIFYNTWSCYEAGNTGWNEVLQTYECGECVHCKTKEEMMRDLGVIK